MGYFYDPRFSLITSLLWSTGKPGDEPSKWDVDTHLIIPSPPRGAVFVRVVSCVFNLLLLYDLCRPCRVADGISTRNPFEDHPVKHAPGQLKRSLSPLFDSLKQRSIRCYMLELWPSSLLSSKEKLWLLGTQKFLP